MKELEIIKEFKWENLNKMYGNAHSSIIGFISSEWIQACKSKTHSIFDGAPGARYLESRRHSDLLLCKDEKPCVVVEVETSIHKYEDKIATLQAYLKEKEKFEGLKYGLLVMLNGFCALDQTNECRFNWDKIENKIAPELSENIGFISIEKENISCAEKNKNSTVSKLRLAGNSRIYPRTISQIQICMPGKDRKETIWQEKD